MKLSVLTVCRNARATIGHALTSFLTQDHADKELVIVDGASRDGTLEVIRSFPADQITLISEPDQGIYDALNKAMARYTGDAVGVLHADDAFHDTGVLTAVARALEGADMVHGSLNFVTDHHDKTLRRHLKMSPRPAGGFRTGWMPAHPTLFVRRHVAEAVGEYDLTMPVAADYDWMLRAIECHDFRLTGIEDVITDMMQGGASTVSIASHIRHNLDALRARRRWLGAGLVDRALFAKPARKLRQFFPGAGVL